MLRGVAVVCAALTCCVQLYGIRKCDRSEAAAEVRVSAALCKVKGDMLLMYLALDADAVAGLERDTWALMLRDARSVHDVSLALAELIAHVHPDWVEHWFYALPDAVDVRVAECASTAPAGAGAAEGADHVMSEASAGAAVADAQSTPVKPAPKAASSLAKLALQLYGLDEALLYQVTSCRVYSPASPLSMPHSGTPRRLTRA